MTKGNRKNIESIGASIRSISVCINENTLYNILDETIQSFNKPKNGKKDIRKQFEIALKKEETREHVKEYLIEWESLKAKKQKMEKTTYLENLPKQKLIPKGIRLQFKKDFEDEQISKYLEITPCIKEQNKKKNNLKSNIFYDLKLEEYKKLHPKTKFGDFEYLLWVIKIILYLDLSIILRNHRFKTFAIDSKTLLHRINETIDNSIVTGMEVTDTLKLKKYLYGDYFYELAQLGLVEINLTKNFCVENEAQDYLNMLMNTSPKGVHPVLFKSKSGQSVYFSYLKRDNKDKEYTGYNIIKFYDKTAELECKTGGNLSNIKLREKLSDAEIEIFEAKYNKASNSINLEDTNLLRVEITYKRSQNLKKIAKFFVKNIDGSIGKPNPKNLPLNVVFDLLECNIFYSGLEQFYREELEKKIFYNNPNPNNLQAQRVTNSYSTTLRNLLLGDNLANIESEMYYINNILEAAGMKNINGHLKSMGENVIEQPLYNELYNSIFNGLTITPPEIDWDLYQFDAEELDLTGEIEEEMQEEPEWMSDEEMDATIDEIIKDEYAIQ